MFTFRHLFLKCTAVSKYGLHPHVLYIYISAVTVVLVCLVQSLCRHNHEYYYLVLYIYIYILLHCRMSHYKYYAVVNQNGT